MNPFICRQGEYAMFQLMDQVYVERFNFLWDRLGNNLIERLRTTNQEAYENTIIFFHIDAIQFYFKRWWVPTRPPYIQRCTNCGYSRAVFRRFVQDLASYYSPVCVNSFRREILQFYQVWRVRQPIVQLMNVFDRWERRLRCGIVYVDLSTRSNPRMLIVLAKELHYSFPKGHIDYYGEDPKQCAIREFKEEARITIPISDLADHYMVDMRDQNDTILYVVARDNSSHTDEYMMSYPYLPPSSPSSSYDGYEYDYEYYLQPSMGPSPRKSKSMSSVRRRTKTPSPAGVPPLRRAMSQTYACMWMRYNSYEYESPYDEQIARVWCDILQFYDATIPNYGDFKYFKDGKEERNYLLQNQAQNQAPNQAQNQAPNQAQNQAANQAQNQAPNPAPNQQQRIYSYNRVLRNLLVHPSWLDYLDGNLSIRVDRHPLDVGRMNFEV